jgi:DNA-binding MarR family transcriptional regulator
MSSPHPSSPEERKRLLEAVLQASQESSTIAVLFHSALAERAGLGATEEKTLALLNQFGSLTAGEIAQHTGLTTPSVTNLIDRLESKGFVRRVRDAHDRRRVIVERNEDRLAELNQTFAALQEHFLTFLVGYSDEQLATIADFLTRAAQTSQAFLAASSGKRLQSHREREAEQPEV